MNSSMREREGVLLLSPPFGSFHDPYISLAVLAGHLRADRIPVYVFNSSAYLVRTFPGHEELKEGGTSLRACIESLNGRSKLKPSEAVQLAVAYPLWQEFASRGIDGLSPETALQISAFPYWPQGLVKRPMVKLMTTASEYSTVELLEAARQDHFFTDILRAKLRTLVAELSPRVVGISLVFGEQAIGAMHCARLLKEIDRAIHVCLGGPFVTGHMADIDNPEIFTLVDSIIPDEGEIPLAMLHAELGRPKPDLSVVAGIIYRNENNLLTRVRPGPPPDLEQAAFTDYSACRLDDYLTPRREMQLSFRLSRGCYWRKCSFCKTSLSYCQNFQQPSVERVFSELKHCAATTGVRRYFFSDESSNPRFLEKLSRKIMEHGLDIRWKFHTRIDPALSQNRVRLFKAAGCRGFSVGIESFNDRILKILNKGITEKLIHSVLSQAGGMLPINAYMMVGIPGETEAEADRSFRYTQEYISLGLITNAIFTLFQLTPGSDMWNRPEKYNYRLLRQAAPDDLNAPVCALLETTTGMDRKMAFAKFLHFNHLQDHSWKDGSQKTTLQDLDIECRYPAGYLQACFGEDLIYQNDMPFRAWMDFLDRRGPVITPL